jgi:hypothetical protein
VLGRRKKGRGGGAADVYHDMRALALGSVAAGLAAPAPDHAGVSGMVVDIASSGGHATVVALTDGTTSMYTSAGGGVIGAGEHAAVAAATHRLLVVAQAHLRVLGSGPSIAELPPPDRVRVHTLTPDGTHTIDLTGDVFWNPAGEPVEPLVAAIQDVLSALREASPS